MLEHVRRIPRSMSESNIESTSESDQWTPDWRNRQAMEYLNAYNERFPLREGETAPQRFIRALRHGMRLPAWEDDRMVMARFHHAAGGQMPDSPYTHAFERCHGLMERDPSTGSSTSLKGWLLAGLANEEILQRLPFSPEIIDIFHDVWFDVRGSLHLPNELWRVLIRTPLPAGAPQWQIHAQGVFWAAIAEGIESVDRMLIPNDRPSESERAWYETQLRRHRGRQGQAIPRE